MMAVPARIDAGSALQVAPSESGVAQKATRSRSRSGATVNVKCVARNAIRPPEFVKGEGQQVLTASQGFFSPRSESSVESGCGSATFGCTDAA